MNKQIMVTVIVPVYNMQQYLDSCLNSILAQVHSNLEVLIVDDGSKDNSRDIALKFTKKDRRVRLITKNNGGVSSARNLGLHHAKGDYVAFVDADDMIHKDYVSVLLGDLIATGADIATSRKHMSRIEEGAFLSMPIDSKAESFSVYDSIDALTSLYNGTLEKGQNGCQIFRLSLIKEALIFYDTRMAIGEDFDFFARAILVSNKVVIDHREMYFYRRNDNSAVHKPFSLKQYEAIYNIQAAGRSVEDKIPSLKRVLDNNLLVTSISYGALMYADREKFPEEFLQIKNNIKKHKYSTLLSRDLKTNSRIKAAIVVVFGLPLGLRLIKKMIRL